VRKPALFCVQDYLSSEHICFLPIYQSSGIECSIRCYVIHRFNVWSFDMLGCLSYNHSRARLTVCSAMQISHSEPCSDVAESADADADADSWTFAFPVIPLIAVQLQVWICAVLLLTLVSPVVIGDNSPCLSEYWCMSTLADDPCSFYSSQTTATVQLCSCINYQHNFTLCLNNVSTSDIIVNQNS